MLQKLYSQMLRYNFKPNNRLDQNFIINKKVIEKVSDLLDIKKEDIILEIGPGTGFLTRSLVQKANKVIAIEKDTKLCKLLKKEIYNANLEIINKDVLKIDLNLFKFNKIVSFVPYSISRDLLYKIIKEKKKMILILQKEFAEKLIALEGYINYNAVSVISQTYYNIKIEKIISQTSFFPKPKCKSAIVSFDPIKDVKFDRNFNKFIKEIFRYSNKNLKKSLKLSNYKIKENIKDKKILEILQSKVKLLNIKELKELYSYVE
jgi:16S rRNA (adenine1518-N6/adenine1519-N6)-dimethyltransferase